MERCLSSIRSADASIKCSAYRGGSEEQVGKHPSKSGDISLLLLGCDVCGFRWE